MAETELHSILRCGQCNKPFDKESTLKRHGYYCRSRNIGSTTRSRSCICCAKRKARCDNRRPQCSRCAKKSIECHYPPNTPKGANPKSRHNNDKLHESQPRPSWSVNETIVIDHQETSNEATATFNNEPLSIGLDFAGGGVDGLEFLDLSVDMSDQLIQQGNSDAVLYHDSVLPVINHYSTQVDDPITQMEQALSIPDLSIPPMLTYSPRSLIHRRSMAPGAQRIRKLIFHTLKSFPTMLIRGDTFPSYIHPHVISSKMVYDIEPLDNCFNLVHMLGHGVRGNQKLFWRNVRQECERMCDLHVRMTRWQLLAALQALSIYIIIRLDQGETDHNNVDSLLVNAVTAVAKRSNDISSSEISDEFRYGNEMTWEDWIFRESGRRLCVVFQVVNLLIYFEPAALCHMQSGLILAPLPAKQHLWEAVDELSWKAETQKEDPEQTSFGLARNGDLVKLNPGRQYCRRPLSLDKSANANGPSKTSERWDEWCLGMDRFGGLIMLAASLIAF